MRRLTAALQNKQQAVVTARSLPRDGRGLAFVVGIAGQSAIVDRLLEKCPQVLPELPESLLVHRDTDVSPQRVLIAGRDARGMAYALLDIARQIELASEDVRLLDMIRETHQSPFLRHRSVTTQIFNDDVERPWYFNESFWHEYFEHLALHRFNNYSLTFGHQTNYKTPVYPWLLDVPGYPSVHVKGLSGEQREKNLQMFKRIAQIASDHGIDFTFGLWSQRPVQGTGDDYGETLLRNFPSGGAAQDYCAKALALLLKECPAIRGVQFRMNDESGIPDSQQRQYFQAQFDAIRNCEPPVRVDLRYKELAQETIDQAVATGLDVTVSTKFWCEHMGLPFHPTAEDGNYSANRYGYGTMLRYPRNYRVRYRLWNVGTSRLLLWGDPQYAARFAESCLMGDGEGFEIFMPLSNKGFGNAPGHWRIFSDRSYEHYQWEYERYWFYYLVFGRLGYDPMEDASTWRREFAARFGDAAGAVEGAYREASQILPLITATRQLSASEWRFWPEMSTCLPLEAYASIQPSDYGQFYAIRRWRKNEQWTAEAWKSERNGFVEEAMADQVEAKWTPIQVSRRLRALADATLNHVRDARQKGDIGDHTELRSTVLDMQVLAHLAHYHAEKLLAATHLEFYHQTAEPGRLVMARRHIKSAAKAWEQIVRLTDGVYHDNLVFGFNAHAGHWKDRLPEVRADVAYIEQLIAKHKDPVADYTVFPGEIPPRDPPVISHRPVLSADGQKDLSIQARVISDQPLRGVYLWYRRMDQTADWVRVTMTEDADGNYRALIPATAMTPQYDMLYYLEARIKGGGTLHPSWEERPPYFVIRIER